MNKKLTNATLAAATALLFSMAPVASFAADEANVPCMGVNACKGQSSCKSANNACKGQNACKGKGVMMTESSDECTSKGGTVQEAAPVAPAS